MLSETKSADFLLFSALSFAPHYFLQWVCARYKMEIAMLFWPEKERGISQTKAHEKTSIASIASIHLAFASCKRITSRHREAFRSLLVEIFFLRAERQAGERASRMFFIGDIFVDQQLDLFLSFECVLDSRSINHNSVAFYFS